MAYPSQRWQAQAACRGHDPDLWFAPSNSVEGLEARRVCASCPVIEECAAQAHADHEVWGTWGQEGPEERVPALRRQRQRGGAAKSSPEPAGSASTVRRREPSLQEIRKASARSRYGRSHTPRPRIATTAGG